MKLIKDFRIKKGQKFKKEKKSSLIIKNSKP